MQCQWCDDFHVLSVLSEFASKMESRTTIPRKQVTRSSSNDSQGFEKNDGSVSDSAVSSSVTEGRKRRPSLGHKVASLVGLNRRSSSATQLAGRGMGSVGSFAPSSDGWHNNRTCRVILETRSALQLKEKCTVRKYP